MMYKVYYYLRSKIRLALFNVILIYSLSNSAHTEESILTVVSDNTPIYKSFYNSLESRLGNIKLHEQVDIAGISRKNLQDFDFVISVGSDAAEILSRTGEINNLIYTMIPNTIAKKINKRPCIAKKCTVVLIEQPIERYFQLFKSLFQDNKTLTIAITTSNHHSSFSLKKIAEKYNIYLKTIAVEKNKTVARSFINQLDRNDVLLALPDPYIYNKDSAKSIILSTYHKNVPIIGYSKAFANAGALISLYSSFDDIASQTANLVDLTNNVNINTHYYPSTFSIEINRSVAKSLNISIDDNDKLKRTIK